MQKRNRDIYNLMWHEYRSNAKKKGRAWELPFEFFKTLITSDCFYCGANPNETRRSSTTMIGHTNGVDRKTAEEGYIPHNVVPCCTTCNFMKHTSSRRDFLKKVEEIHAHTQANKNIRENLES